MMKKIFLIAEQRSGTNALRLCLQNTGFFIDHNEIFRAESINDPDSFIKFRSEFSNRKSFFDLTEHVKIWNAYLHFIEINSDDKIHIFDIKTNSLLHFEEPWASPCDIPFFLKILAKNNDKIIYLTRDNILHKFASLKLAVENNKFGISINEKNNNIKKIKKIIISTEELIQYIKIKEYEKQLLEFWFTELSKLGLEILHLKYEELFDPSQTLLSLNTVNAIIQFLNLENISQESFQLVTLKQSPNLKDFVLNYDSEIIPTLKSYGYEKYLDSSNNYTNYSEYMTLKKIYRSCFTLISENFFGKNLNQWCQPNGFNKKNFLHPNAPGKPKAAFLYSDINLGLKKNLKIQFCAIEEHPDNKGAQLFMQLTKEGSIFYEEVCDLPPRKYVTKKISLPGNIQKIDIIISVTSAQNASTHEFALVEILPLEVL